MVEPKYNYDKIYADLFSWFVKRNWKGLDPYDALHTNQGIWRSWKPLRLVLNYFHKFSPINFRFLFGVQPSKDNQAIALIIDSIIEHPPMGVDVKPVLKELSSYLVSKSLKDDVGFHCWNGHSFYIQTTREYQAPNMPGIVGTAAVANALLACQKALGPTEEIDAILKDVRKFYLEKLLVDKGMFVFLGINQCHQIMNVFIMHL